MSLKRPFKKRAKNLGLAAIAGQAGCASLIIVFIALFLGLWLDSETGQRGPFTFGLLLISVPFSLYVMLKIALGATNLIDPPARDDDLIVLDTPQSEEVDL